MPLRRLTIVLLGALLMAAVPETRVKDLVNVEGIRDNQLLGYGLVVGLNGTGDKRQTVFSAQSLTNLLARMGVQVAPTAILVRNTAAVLVAATLPAFAQPGSKVDITVAAIGDASNLQGGLLVMTPLKGPDGQVYAMAQGSVVTGGFVAGRGGNSQTVNHPTAGRVPSGAIIERNSPSIEPAGRIRLQLRQSDHTSAARIARVINARFGSTDNAQVARAVNSGLITVDAPPDWKGRPVEFISEVEELPIDSDRQARVVVNERTGTIVMGQDIGISPVTILHGAL
ncbi:MAG TPA: flagellar basal body P-ring protein FlgI, partial [Bryobacteraceae bacterium]|nr:flagellar basal body P-ring protein FlgI [Bryobacteraceae bacterium]